MVFYPTLFQRFRAPSFALLWRDSLGNSGPRARKFGRDVRTTVDAQGDDAHSRFTRRWRWLVRRIWPRTQCMEGQYKTALSPV